MLVSSRLTPRLAHIVTGVLWSLPTFWTKSQLCFSHMSAQSWPKGCHHLCDTLWVWNWGMPSLSQCTLCYQHFSHWIWALSALRLMQKVQFFGRFFRGSMLFFCLLCFTSNPKSVHIQSNYKPQEKPKERRTFPNRLKLGGLCCHNSTWRVLLKYNYLRCSKLFSSNPEVDVLLKAHYSVFLEAGLGKGGWSSSHPICVVYYVWQISMP